MPVKRAKVFHVIGPRSVTGGAVGPELGVGLGDDCVVGLTEWLEVRLRLCGTMEEWRRRRTVRYMKFTLLEGRRQEHKGMI